MQSDGKLAVSKIAVLVTKEPIDYNKINKAISKATGSSYEEKVKNALGSMLTQKVNFSGNSVVDFSTVASSDKAVAFIIGIKK